MARAAYMAPEQPEPYRSTRALCLMVGLAVATNQRPSAEQYMLQLLAWVAWAERDIVPSECA